MRESLTLRLSGGPRAPGRARNALRSLDRTLADLRDDVDLLVSELVSNSVLHARAEQIELRADAHRGGVRVEVSDPGPGFDESGKGEHPGMGHEGGYGLFIVDKVADRWGVTRDQRARVWFEIDRAPGRDRSPDGITGFAS
jgi:anti-sigma regulatory factor (Ser/Thr protein kinase)